MNTALRSMNTALYGLVDEEKGGIIAYFISRESALVAAETLNTCYGYHKEKRYWVHTMLDKENYKDLLKQIVENL